MILFMENGRQIRGDLIESAILRSDAAPVPLTLEAHILAGDELMAAQLATGRVLTTAAGVALRIVHMQTLTAPQTQGERVRTLRRVTAILDACAAIAYVKNRAIIKENATLANIYRAAGANVAILEGDFAAARFVCLAGHVPSFHIARIVQEAGGIIRLKNNKLQFIRVEDIIKQNPVKTLNDNASDEVQSQFLQRHNVPSFYSLDDKGGLVNGDFQKIRSIEFSPFKNAHVLHNMSRCLIHKKTVQTEYNHAIHAGDCVELTGAGKLAVVTAAHIYQNGPQSAQYSQLWLSEVGTG